MQLCRAKTEKRSERILVSGMVIKARYEGGVFKPLKGVALAEGTVLDIEIPKPPRKRSSLRRSGFGGMWKDRKDIKGGVYEDRLRQPVRA